MTDPGPQITPDHTITDSIFIQAKPAEVFNALTNSIMLKQWFCNQADVSYRAHEGGSYYFGWDGGYQVVGKFMTLEPGRVVLTWRGAGEPETRVEYLLAAENGGTHVTMTHSGYGANDAKLMDDHRDGWTGSLERLKYFVENGLDLRIVQRPMIGIGLSSLTPELAAQLGVPVSKGIVIDAVRADFSADKAGIKTRDVITRMNNVPVGSYDDLTAALRGKVAGDVIPVTFYRGQEAHTVQMELSQRPMPVIPATAAELAARQLERYDDQMRQIKALVKDQPDSVLSAAPAEGEWSVNHNLAHLIWSERCVQLDLWNLYGGGYGYDWPDNNIMHLAGIMAVYATNADLIAELQRSFTATIAMLKALTPENADVKSVFARMAQSAFNMADHTDEHIAQITQTLQQIIGAAAS